MSRVLRKFYPGTVVSVTFVAAAVIGLGFWAHYDARKAQYVLEQDFERFFQQPYPANEEARLTLRPGVVLKLVAQRARIKEVEGKESSILERIRRPAFSGTAAMLTAALEDEERIERLKTVLQERFRVVCRIAQRAGFKREANVSGCQYYAPEIVGLLSEFP